MSARPGLLHIALDTLSWNRVDVRGTVMDEALIFQGDHDVLSAFYRIAAGQVIREHTHADWVQVMVLQGCIRVEQEGSEVVEAKTGSVYFVDPESSHIETALTESIVLVTQGEDRPEWKKGASRKPGEAI